MLKIWAKTMVKDKITRDLIYSKAEQYNHSAFRRYLVDICHEMDIPTPIILKSHKRNFTSFNTTRFKEDDFVESIDFDTLVLEYAGD